MIRALTLIALIAGCARMPGAAVDAGDDPPQPPPDARPDPMTPDADPSSPWRLVWSDEFDGPAGQRPDPSKWTAEIGGHGWGNDELQFYTDRTSNASLDGSGNLAIVARAERFGDRDFTSARLITRDTFQRTYGRYEARMRLPQTQAIWPAFWLLGGNYQTAIWPECGEIDVMEQRGQAPEVVHGSLHGPGYSAGGALTRAKVVTGSHPSQEFHVYAIEWRPGRIEWFIDDVPYFSMTASEAQQFGRWVYDHPFFIILNIAVGGHFVGWPNETTVLPQTMLVDYVRVYEAAQ